MLIDINTYIGHWPFRQLRNNDVTGIINIMDETGVDKACISSINSIFYKDTQEGNQELIEQIKPYRDRFYPFTIINPSYPGWKNDFLYCIDNLEMTGLELYPYYHNYSLTDDNTIELLQLAAEKNVAVHLPCSIINIRQRHWLDTKENLDIEQVKKIMGLSSKTDFIISYGPTSVYAEKLKEITEKREGRVYYDFNRISLFNDFDQLKSTAGIENIVFSSQIPFQYIDPQLIKLELMEEGEEKEMIKYKNAQKLLTRK